MKLKKVSLGSRLFDIFNYCLMVFLGFIAVYPFVHVLFASFSEGTKLAQQTGLLLRPAGFSLAAYSAVFQNPDIYSGFLNTIFYVVVGTALATFVTVMFAYSLANSRVKYRKFLIKMVTVTMFFSGGMIPSYLVVKGLGLIDSRWALIIPGLSSAYNVFVMRAAFMAVPPGLEESARLDGANDFLIFWKIVLPIVKPTVAMIVLYFGVAKWNGWFQAMLYLSDRAKYPLQLFLREILVQSTMEGMDTLATSDVFLSEVIKHATTVVATVPILAIYPLLQKYFVKGVMIGAVKG